MSIDYARADRMNPKLKAALTRAVNSGRPEKVRTACTAAVIEWREWGAWPDGWHRWQVALDDINVKYDLPRVRLEDLA